MPANWPDKTQYQECQKCGAVFPWVDRPDAAKPTPCCKSNEALFEWPELTVGTMLDLVRAQELGDHDKRKVAVVFLAAILEQLLFQALVMLLPKHIKTKDVAIALLDANEGQSRRRKLFKTLSGKSVGEVLQPLKLERFVNDWSTLVEIRNNIAHGDFFNTHLDETQEIELLHRIYADCLPVFAAIHNHARLSSPAKS